VPQVKTCGYLLCRSASGLFFVGFVEAKNFSPLQISCFRAKAFRHYKLRKNNIFSKNLLQIQNLFLPLQQEKQSFSSNARILRRKSERLFYFIGSMADIEY